MSVVRVISEERKEEFAHKGYKGRYFFPHETYYLPRCAPEGYFFANRMWNMGNPNALWELVLFACGDAIKEFPEALFFDKEIVWHEEHFGKPGQVAAANLIIDEDRLYTLEHISDLVQRIHLRKEYRTRINSHFKHWHHMLLNGVLNFAVENDLTCIYSPTADLLVNKFYNGKTKPKVDRKYFDRIYDRDVQMHFDVRQEDGMWLIDVGRNRHKLIAPEKKIATVSDKKTICIYHDTENWPDRIGAGQVQTQGAGTDAAKTLETILAVERDSGIKTTYNIVGSFLKDVRAEIEQDGHCVAFHSYNHQLSRQPVTNYMAEETALMTLLSKIGYKVTYGVNLVRRLLSLTPVCYQPFAGVYPKVLNRVRKQLALPPIINQFAACRRVDWRIKGYRHYQPALSAATRDNDLCYYNFEWIAIDNQTPGAKPRLENRVIKIPTFCDAYEMHKHQLPYEAWEDRVIERIKQSDFTSVGFHDCYADDWLTHYARFLDKIRSLGQLKTLNEAADQVFLAQAI